MAERDSQVAPRGVRRWHGKRGAPAMMLRVLAAVVFAAGAAQTRAQDRARPVVSVAPVIQAQSAKTTALPIRVTPASAVPRQAFLRIRGLPPTVALSEGHSIAVGAWAVPLSALPSLR